MCNEGGEGGEWGLIDKIGKDEQIYIEIVYRERERERSGDQFVACS